MPDALGTAIMGNHIDTISNALTVTYMIALRLRVAASFEDGLIRTFG